MHVRRLQTDTAIGWWKVWPPPAASSEGGQHAQDLLLADDDLACESFDYGDESGAPPPGGGDDGALPSTGPGDRQLPVGTALVTGGLALVLATQRRYRARHLRR
jgi:hypothetical protein